MHHDKANHSKLTYICIKFDSPAKWEMTRWKLAAERSVQEKTKLRIWKVCYKHLLETDGAAVLLESNKHTFPETNIFPPEK